MGKGGIFITEDEYLRMVQDGCANCTGPILLRDHLRIAWTNDGQPVCSTCQQDLKDYGVMQ